MNRRHVFKALAGAALLVHGAQLLASESMQVKSIQMDLSPEDGAVLLTAQFVVDLSGPLKDAVERGLPLHFVTEYQLLRQRNLWFDKETGSGQIEWRLSYHALTRQYRLSSVRGSESFPTLDEAIAQMTHVRDWIISRVEHLEPEQEYWVRVRMRLDTSRLPKPFQITALTDSEWNPQAEWKGMSFVVPTKLTPDQ